ELAHVVDRLVDADHVVVDVAEVEPRLGENQRAIEADETVTDLDERRDRSLESEHVALQLIDPLRDLLAAMGSSEDLLLEPGELLLGLVDDRKIVIDDEIHDGVKDESRP